MKFLYMHSICGEEISVHISVHTHVGVSSHIHACAWKSEVNFCVVPHVL